MLDRNAIRRSATDKSQIKIRFELASYASSVFQEADQELFMLGHIIGSDRREGVSPFGHGNDETVALSMILRIGSQLVHGSANLIKDGQHYAGSALIRQLVEIEYLAWAFEEKSEESVRWLRSTHSERKNFFTPAKLRKAAGSRFRSVDYGHHCELGGHPVPGAWVLLNDDLAVAQLMLSDCLGHSGRIWDHVTGWAKRHPNGSVVLSRSQKMIEFYQRWKAADELATLPMPS